MSETEESRKAKRQKKKKLRISAYFSPEKERDTEQSEKLEARSSSMAMEKKAEFLISEQLMSWRPRKLKPLSRWDHVDLLKKWVHVFVRFFIS